MSLTPQESKVERSFCTTREAARILGISISTAQLWAESGLLEGWKTEGGHRRISRASIERLLAMPGPDRATAPAVAGPAIAAEPVRAPADARSEAFQILVVEDQEDLLKLYTLNLGLWALRPKVLTARHGFEALIKLGMQKPDLLIADLFMPDFDGFMMLKCIRAVPEFHDMPVVVVTGLSPEDVASRGGVPEGVRLLPKPIPFPELERVANEIAQCKLTRDIGR